MMVAWRRLTGLALAALAVVLLSSLAGYRWINPSELLGGAAHVEVYWRLRAPRTVLAAVVGAGLAVGGAVFQTLFRNPLATPYTLGIASGASLAAATAFLLRLGGTYAGIPVLSLFATGGAAAATAAVLLMARLRTQGDLSLVLLAGVCIAYLSSAGVMLVTYLTNPTVTNDIVMWLMGSLAIHRPRAIAEILIVLGPVLAYVLASHRAFDLLSLGETLAASRGVAVQRVTWVSFCLIGLLTAFIVGACGPIGFVGLMAPHFARQIVGPRFLPAAIASALLGAAFLAACDALARIPAQEIPVGVLTNILGATFFFVLLVRRAGSVR